MWSVHVPGLQIVWDSTSLGALMFCPEYYNLSIRRGWRKDAIDLEFGLRVGKAFEIGDRTRAAGGSLEDALAAAYQEALNNTVHRAEDGTWSHWAGRYEELWHCLHEPAKGKKKCLSAYKGKWFPGPTPTVCGDCGSEVEARDAWVPDDPRKNRITLLRMIAWYYLEKIERGGDAVEPYVFPDGSVGAELHFLIPLGVFTDFRLGPGYTPKPREEFWIAGYFDNLVVFGPENFILERKTTKSTLSRNYIAGFSPSQQIDTYDLAGTILFPDLDIKGVMLEAAQVMVGGARFTRQPLHRNEDLREEWHKELTEDWLPLAEHYARQGRWPKARRNCWLCDFKGVCSKPPGSRERALKADFYQEFWDPTKER